MRALTTSGTPGPLSWESADSFVRSVRPRLSERETTAARSSSFAVGSEAAIGVVDDEVVELASAEAGSVPGSLSSTPPMTGTPVAATATDESSIVLRTTVPGADRAKRLARVCRCRGA